MELDQYQIKVDQWIKEVGVRYFDPMTNMALLMEEVGELARIMARKYGEQSFKKPMSIVEVNQAIEDELADILFVLTCLANQNEIDWITAVERNFTKKTNRDNSRHKDHLG